MTSSNDGGTPIRSTKDVDLTFHNLEDESFLICSKIFSLISFFFLSFFFSSGSHSVLVPVLSPFSHTCKKGLN
jgi:hypothetical protein